jgi:hypothetical protein
MKYINDNNLDNVVLIAINPCRAWHHRHNYRLQAKYMEKGIRILLGTCCERWVSFSYMPRQNQKWFVDKIKKIAYANNK